MGGKNALNTVLVLSVDLTQIGSSPLMGAQRMMSQWMGSSGTGPVGLAARSTKPLATVACVVYELATVQNQNLVENNALGQQSKFLIAHVLFSIVHLEAWCYS